MICQVSGSRLLTSGEYGIFSGFSATHNASKRSWPSYKRMSFKNLPFIASTKEIIHKHWHFLYKRLYIRENKYHNEAENIFVSARYVTSCILIHQRILYFWQVKFWFSEYIFQFFSWQPFLNKILSFWFY